jgi:dihydrofolate synthase/folylpolyglutamate synthase
MSGALAGALAELYARVPRGMELGLDKMRAACKRFDHPEAKFKAIHVAGTNGKGSVCAMVERIAREEGKRTGLYTSPHLHKFSERIRVNGVPISDPSLERILSDVLARAPELSFFEAATMTAFVAFAEASVDIAVIEVGIGGRLDATNVIEKPLVTAITRIAFDHMDKLGNTLSEIAREKAGIAKRGIPLVLGPIEGEALEAIEAVAKNVGAPIQRARGTAMVSGTNLPGAHQWVNANVAIQIAFALGWHQQAILMTALREVSWPGRLELLETPRGQVLIDAAHNPDGAKALAEYLKDPKVPPHFNEPTRLGKPVALVFGTLADKAWPEMIDTLAPLAKYHVYTAPKGRAPTPLESLNARQPGKMAANPIDAHDLARELVGPDGLVVVAGSIFLIAEIRAQLLGLPSDPVVAL